MNQYKYKSVLADASNQKEIIEIIKNQELDICSSFFLIHEIPLEYKKHVINNMLINA